MSDFERTYQIHTLRESDTDRELSTIELPDKEWARNMDLAAFIYGKPHKQVETPKQEAKIEVEKIPVKPKRNTRKKSPV